MIKYTIYTDGAYSSKYDIGGIGFVILNDKGELVCKFNKGYQRTTNQRMEQTAVLHALNTITVPAVIDLYTDSMYVVGTYTKNWKRKRNIDLWDLIDDAIDKHEKVNFIHIKGHARERNYNVEADRLATAAIHGLCD